MIKSKEEIKTAAIEHVRQVGGDKACYDSFVTGAEWASQFPSQGLREEFHCPSCGKIWDTEKFNACECGATIQRTSTPDSSQRLREEEKCELCKGTGKRIPSIDVSEYYKEDETSTPDGSQIFTESQKKELEQVRKQILSETPPPDITSEWEARKRELSKKLETPDGSQGLREADGNFKDKI